MLEWIQSSGIAHLVQSSLWGYVIVLSSHAIGMAVLVGLTLVIYLRLLGMAPDVPLPPLRSLMHIALIGFAINLISGSMLFAADAYYFVGSWPFRIKFGLLLLSAVLLGITYRRLAGEKRRVGRAVGRLSRQGGPCTGHRRLVRSDCFRPSNCLFVGRR